MKHLRKLVTLLLVLTMALSSVGVFAAESSVTQSVGANTKFSDIEAGSKVESAVTKLVAYNIISGYPDGTFKPDGQITRGEFAAVITRFEGIAQSLGSDAVTGFADLDNDVQNAWARPYVKAAVDAGIINGFDDGTFRAGEPVTYEQAIKMIICAIDYQVVANSELARLQATNAANITWSSGYIAAANKNNITLGAMTANITGPATRGIVAILTSNALDAPKLNIKDDGSVEKEDPADREERLTELDGIVTGTYYTGVDEEDAGLSNIQLRIDANRENRAYDLSDDVLKNIDFEDILGKKVVAYYDNQERVITTISESSNNEITTIKEEQIYRPINGDVIKYENDRGRTENISLSDYTIIWNGKYVDSLPNMESEFTNGVIELLEAPGSKVAKITSYDVFVVNSYDKTNSRIYFKYGKTFNNGSGEENFYLFPAKTADKPQIFVNGTKKDFDNLSLSAYNVINYMESPRGAEGPAIKKMYVTTASKSGRVTAELDGDREVELNETSMYLTNDYYEYEPQNSGDEEKAPFTLDDNYTYYLDYTGQIAAIKYSSTSSTGSYNYGYVVAVGDVNGTPSIKFMSKNGITNAYPLKSNVKVDGDKMSNDDVEDYLENVVYAGANISGYYQPVRYSISGGSVDAIDTVRSVAGGTADNLSYAVTDTTAETYSTGVKANGTTYALDSSTIVLYVPDTRNNTSEYAYMTASKAFATKANRRVEVLAVDENSANKLAKFVLVYGVNPSLNYVGNSPYMVVTKNISDGEGFEGYVNGALTEISVSEDKFYTGLSANDVTASEVGKGDVIRYLTIGSGDNAEIVAIEMVYDASEQALGTDDENDDARLYEDWTDPSNFIARYGEVVVMNDGDNTISVTTVLKGEDGDVNDAALVFKTSSAKVYELSNGNVTKLETLGYIDDITTANPTRVLVIAVDNKANTSANVIYLLK